MTPEEALKEIVATRGAEIGNNASLVEALLRDYCPESRAEVHCLVSAAREKIPQAILGAAPGASRESLRGVLRQRLAKAFYMEESRADWAVVAWMSALTGFVPPKPAEEPKKAAAPVKPVAKKPEPMTIGQKVLTGIFAVFLVGLGLMLVAFFAGTGYRSVTQALAHIAGGDYKGALFALIPIGLIALWIRQVMKG